MSSRCTWIFDDDSGLWSTECGDDVSLFDSDRPLERWTVCHVCGGRIELREPAMELQG